MVRETRYLWVGNLPEKASEEQISEVFARHGKIQSVKLLSKDGDAKSVCAIVAFMDIKSASKAQNCENKLDGTVLQTQYSEPSATGTGVTVTRPHVPASAGAPGAADPPSRSLYSQQPRNLTSRFPGRSATDSGDDSRSSFDRPSPVSGLNRAGTEEKERGRTKQRYPASATWQGTQGGVKQRLGVTKGSSPARATDSAGRSQLSKASSRPGQESRSRSRSSSASSRSSKSGSRSRSQSKTGEGKKKAIKTEKEELGLLIRGLPVRSSDSSLRDGLFHEYKKYGKVTSVSVIGSAGERHAVVSFKKSEDAAKAYEQSLGKKFFGSQIHVERHEGFEVDDSEFQPPEAELDEYHHKATRTLFVGNLELEIDKQQLRSIFQKYGFIVDIDIKKQGNLSCYAFVQYDDIKSVVQALRDMDGEFIGKNKIKLGFGKSMPTNCVWVDGICENVAEKFLARQFNRYGHVTQSVIDRDTCRGLVYFDDVDVAQRAVSEMRGRAIGGKKIQIDFASRDCQTLFFDNMERTGQIGPVDRPDDSSFNDAVSMSSLSNFNYEDRLGFREERPGFERQGQYSTYERAGWTKWGGTSTGASTWGAPGFRSNAQRPTVRGTRGSGNSSGPPSRSSSQDSKPYFEGSSFPPQGEAYPPRERRSRQPGNFDGYEGDNYADSYEQALREYAQRERREGSRERRRGEAGRSDSPFSRTSSRYDEPPGERYNEYGERYRDTDSQSGERESVRSYRSETRGRAEATERPYDEHYASDRFSDKARALSPTSSEQSGRSKSPPQRYRQRSQSSSPSPSSVRGRKGRSAYYSRSPEREDYAYRGRSPSVEYFKHKEPKAKKAADHYDSDSEHSRSHKGRAASRLSSTEDKYGKGRKARDLDSGASDMERGWPEAKPSRKRTLEEYFAQQQKEEPPDDGRLRRPPPQRQPSSHGLAERSGGKTAEREKPEEPDMGSTTSGSKTPMDSDQESFGEHTSSHSGSGEVNQLEKEKVHLLSLLQQLDDSDTSDGEEDRAHKKPRLDEVFDLERDPSLSMRRWREQAKRLVAAGHDTTELQQQLQAVPSSSADKPAATLMQDILQQSEKLKPLDTAKFRPIDASQSFRKQMEARRRMEDHRRKASGGGRQLSPEDEEGEEAMVSDHSDAASDFVPSKRCRLSSKSKRSYRGKHRESNGGMSSSEGEDRSPYPRHPAPEARDDGPPTRRASKGDRSRADSVSSRSDSGRPSHLRRDSRDSRTSAFELRSSEQPRIIPDCPVDSRGPDGKPDGKRIPQEPRSLPDSSKKDYPMSLPLPRFAKTAFQNMKAKAAPSPRAPSPKATSPPFSPAIHSPAVQMSPPMPSDRANEEPPPPPPPPPPPEEEEVASTSCPPSSLSSSCAVSDLQNKPSEEEDKGPPPGSESPPPPPPPPTDTSSSAKESSEGGCADEGSNCTEAPKPMDTVTSDIKTDTVSVSPLKVNAKTDSDSDSDLISPTSPGRPSLEERIRALDEKLQNFKPKSSSGALAADSSAASTPPTKSYRDKFRVRKRIDSLTTLGSPAGCEKSEPSAIVKSILSRSTIFDQDTKRLEQSGNPDAGLEASHKLHSILKKSPTSSLSPLEAMPAAASLVRQGSTPEASYPSGCTSDLMSAAGYPMLNQMPSPAPTPLNYAGFPYAGQRSPAYSAGIPTVNHSGLSPSPLSTGSSRQSSVESQPPTPGASTPGARPCDPRRAAHDHMRGLASPPISRNPHVIPNYPPPVAAPIPVPDTGKLTVTVSDPLVTPTVATVTSSPPVLKKQDSSASAETGLLTVSPVKPPLADLTKSKEMNSPPIPILKKEGPEVTPASNDKKSNQHKSHKRKANEAFGDNFLVKTDSLKTEKKGENGGSKSSDSGAAKSETSKPESAKKEKKHENSASASSKSHSRDGKKHSHKSSSSSKSGDKGKDSSHGEKKADDKSKHHEKKSGSSSKSSSSSKDKSSSEHKGEKAKKEQDSDKAKASPEKQSKAEKESKNKEKCEKSPKFDKTDKKDKDDKGKGRGSSNGKHSTSSSSAAGTDAKSKSEDKSSGDKQQKSQGSKGGESKSSESNGNSSKQAKDGKEKSGSKHENKHDKQHSQEKHEKSKGDKAGGSSSSSSSHKAHPHKSKSTDKGSKEKPKGDKEKSKSKPGSDKSSSSSSKSESKSSKPDSHHSSKSSDKKEKPDGSKIEKPKSKPSKDDKSKSSRDRKSLDSKKEKTSSDKKKKDEDEKTCASRGRKKSETKEGSRELMMLTARWDGENESPEPYFSMYDMVKRRSNKERAKEESEKKIEDLKHKFDKLQEKRRQKSRMSTSLDADSSMSDMYEEDSEEGRKEAANKKTAARRSSDHKSAKQQAKRILNSSSDEEDLSSFTEVPEPKKPPPKKSPAVSRISDDSSTDLSSTESDSDFNFKKTKPKKPPPAKSKPNPPAAPTQNKKKPYSIYTTTSDSDSDSDEDAGSRHEKKIAPSTNKTPKSSSKAAVSNKSKPKSASNPPETNKKPASKVFGFTSSSDSTSDSDSDIRPSFSAKKKKAAPLLKLEDDCITPKTKAEVKAKPHLNREHSDAETKKAEPLKKDSFAYTSESDDHDIEEFRSFKNKDKKESNFRKTSETSEMKKSKDTPKADRESKRKKKSSSERSVKNEAKLEKTPPKLTVEEKLSPKVKEEGKRPETPRSSGQERASIFEVVEEQKRSPRMDQRLFSSLSASDVEAEKDLSLARMSDSARDISKKDLEFDDDLLMHSKSKSDSDSGVKGISREDSKSSLFLSRSDNIFEKMELKEDTTLLMTERLDSKDEKERTLSLSGFDSDSSDLPPLPLPDVDDMPGIGSEKSVEAKSEETKEEEEDEEEEEEEEKPASPEVEPVDVKSSQIEEDNLVRSDVESEVSQGLVIDETSNLMPDAPFTEDVPEVVVSESGTLSESEAEPDKPQEAVEPAPPHSPPADKETFETDPTKDATSDDETEETEEASGPKIGGQTEQSIQLATDSLAKELVRDEGKVAPTMDSVSPDFSSVELGVEGLSTEEAEEARDELNAAIENLIEKHLEPSIEEQNQLEIQTVEETVVPPEDSLVEGSEQGVEIVEEVQIEQAPSVEVTSDEQPSSEAIAEVAQGCVVDIQSHPPQPSVTEDHPPVPLDDSKPPADPEPSLPPLRQPDMSLVPDMYKGAPTEPQREPVVLRGEQLEEPPDDKFDEYSFEPNETPTKPARGRGRGRGGRGRGRKKAEDNKHNEMSRGKNALNDSSGPDVSQKIQEMSQRISDVQPKDPAQALVDFVKEQNPLPFHLDGSRLSQSEYIANITNNLDFAGHNDMPYLPNKVFPALEHEISKLDHQNRKAKQRTRRAGTPRTDKSESLDSFEEFRLQHAKTPTRGSPRQTEAPTTSPTPPNMRRKSDGPEITEKFSSRGRKIIPKERDDEFTGLNRKNRKPVTPKENEPDSPLTPKGRGRRNSAAPSPVPETEPGKPKRGRKTSIKSADSKIGLENLAPDAEVDAHDPEDRMEGDDKKLRRRSQRKGREEGEGPGQPSSVSEGSCDPHDTSNEEQDQNTANPQDKPKRPSRKGRGKKPSDLTPGSPRRSESEGGMPSPKTASPKSSPVVKLEKLALDHLMRDEGKKDGADAKDLYAWEDDDEKPLPEYTHKRPLSRKRKASESEQPAPPPSEPEPAAVMEVKPEPVTPAPAPPPSSEPAETSPPEPKRTKVVAKPESPAEKCEVPLTPIVAPEHTPPPAVPAPEHHPTCTLPPKKDPQRLAEVNAFLPEPHRPSEHRHLPLKLEMKKEAAAKAKALAEASKQQLQQEPPPPVSTPDLSSLKEPTPSLVSTSSGHPDVSGTWQSNMDRVIFEVAKGNFERGMDFDYYTKQREKQQQKEVEPFSRARLPKEGITQPLTVNTAVVGPHPIPSPVGGAKSRLSPRMKSPPAPITPVTSTKTQSPPAQAAPAPSMYQSVIQTPSTAAETSPMLALQKAGYPVSTAQQQKPGMHLPPDAAGLPGSRPVHIGVVPSQAYSMSNQESSPQGQQVIEKVPNPHLKGPDANRGIAPVSTPQTAYQGRMPVGSHASNVAHPVPASQAEARPRSGSIHRANSPEVALVRPQPQQVAVAPQSHLPSKPDLRLPTQQQPQMSPQLPKDHSPGLRQPSPHLPMPPPHAGGHMFPGNYPAALAASQHSPPISSQASELRAALAQPSILIQQEQILQQQQQRMQREKQSPKQQQPQQQQQPRGAPPPAHQGEHRQSPGVIGLGQHKMPYTFTEPRSARAEPKSTSNNQQLPPVSTEAVVRPEMHQPGTYNHLSELKPDSRPGLPPGEALRPGLPPYYHLPFPPGALPIGVPRMPLDPRMMFSQQMEFLAHQGLGPMLPGMVAPQPPPAALLAAQQGTATEHHASDRPSSARPPSRHPTPPSAQPSPRTSTPHTPVIPTAQMPPMQPPIMRLPPDMTPGHSNDMAMLLQRYPVMWQGQLVLKNDSSAVQMHFVSGSKRLVGMSLPQMGSDGVVGPLRIAQRMRLEQTQLEGVAKRMESDQEYSMLLALPCGHDHMDIIQQSTCLRQGFINYLQQKQAAGIVNVYTAGPQPAYVVHIFPPCAFSSGNLSDAAPDLLHSVSEMAYLLVIIATVSS